MIVFYLLPHTEVADEISQQLVNKRKNLNRLKRSSSIKVDQQSQPINKIDGNNNDLSGKNESSDEFSSSDDNDDDNDKSGGGNDNNNTGSGAHLSCSSKIFISNHNTTSTSSSLINHQLFSNTAVSTAKSGSTISSRIGPSSKQK